MLRILSFLVLCWLSCATMQAQNSDCTPRDYDRLMGEAKRLARNGEYDQAINKLQSAKTCQPQRETEVNREILRVFEKVNGERKRAEEQTRKAEAEARRIYANDLAFKSEVALRQGDRTTAFRLAEFAYNYADTLNPKVIQAMMRVLYHNDGSDQPFLPWCTHTLIEYPLDVYSTSMRDISLSTDGELLAAQYWENDTIKIFNIENGAKLQGLIPDCPSKILAFSINEGKLAIACTGKGIQFWDVSKEKLLPGIDSDTLSIVDIAFSHDQKLMATICSDTTIKIWNLETGLLQQVVPNQHSHIHQVIFSHTDQLLSFMADEMVKVWHLGENQEILSIEKCCSVFQNMAFSWNDQWLAVIAADYAVEIWEIQSKTKTKTLPTYFSASCLLFVPNRPLLVVGDFDHHIKIWDIPTTKVVQSLVGHATSITKIVLSENVQRLVSLDLTTAKIWELDSMPALQLLRGHNSSISSISASPTRPWIASGSEDKTAKIWDIHTGETIRHFTDFGAARLNHGIN